MPPETTHTAPASSPYWVVDPANQVFTVYRRSERAYEVALTAGAKDTVRAEPFEAIEVFVGPFFGLELPDPE